MIRRACQSQARIEGFLRLLLLLILFVTMPVGSFIAIAVGRRQSSLVAAAVNVAGRPQTRYRHPTLSRSRTTASFKRLLSSSKGSRQIQAFIEGALIDARIDPADDRQPTDYLSRSAIHRMRVADLRLELQHRRQDTSGTKKDLVPRLLQVLTFDNIQQEEPGEQTSALESDARLDPSKRYILRVKGLSSLSSNGTGVGFLLIDEEDPTVYWEARKYLQGNRSVFEAEYSALVVAMRYALRRGAKHLIVQMDHEVIQQQIMGTFSVEKESLKGLYWKFMSCKESLMSFSTQLVSALDNQQSSDMAKKALATGKSLNVQDSYDPMAEQRRKKMQNGAGPLENDQATGWAIDPMRTYRLQFDGGARSNPTGVAGAGMVLYDDQGNEIWCGWKYLAKMSNNAAEYWALLLGLKCALSLGVKRIKCQGDSELIIKQVTGIYRVKDMKLKALYEPTKDVAAKFDQVSFEHIYRNANERADWLANYAMDTQTDHGFEEI